MKTKLIFAFFLGAIAARAGIAEHVVRTQVAGMEVYADKTSLQEIVSLHGYFPAGNVFNPPGNPALAGLVAGMLSEGTMQHDKLTLARQLERLGASISFGAGSQMTSFSVRCLKEDLPVVLGLLAEELRQPAFTPEEFAKLQKRVIGGLEQERDDTGARAGAAFSRALFPAGHPNRQFTPDEMIAAVTATKVDDLKAFHRAHYGPAYLKMVAVGDVDLPVLTDLLQKNFGDWTGGTPSPNPPAKAHSLDVAKEQVVFVPGKTSVDVLLGQATGLRYTDPDRLALSVGTEVLGSGFTGRLMSTVRDREGLTYGIGAGTSCDTFVDGYWAINATFAPGLLEKGVGSTRRQLDRWWQGGVTAEELAARKENLIGSFQVGLATTDGLAGNLVVALQRGVGIEWLDQYPAKVNALTVEQVNGAIRKYLDPRKMISAEAGTIEGAAKP